MMMMLRIIMMMVCLPVKGANEIEALVQQALILEPHVVRNHVLGPANQGLWRGRRTVHDDEDDEDDDGS